MGVAYSKKINVLCDETTFQAAKVHGIEFDTSLEKVMVKGKKEAIAIFVPLAGKKVESVKVPKSLKLIFAKESNDEKTKKILEVHEIIGREELRHQIGHVVDNFLQGKDSGVMLIEGETGLGFVFFA